MAYTADTRITRRGKASVEGINGAIDVIVYPVAQSANINFNFDEEVIKGNNGYDAAWLARNAHYLADFKFKVIADTAAHAQAACVFLAPFATVVLSDFVSASINGSYQNISGSTIDLANTSVADLSTKFRRYDNATQATASVTTPT